jgi:predicted metal-binding membrane protein
MRPILEKQALEKQVPEKKIAYSGFAIEPIWLIMAVVTMGWTYTMLHLLNLNHDAGYGNFGPGMGIFDVVNTYLIDNSYLFLANLPICTTFDEMWTIKSGLSAFSMWFSMVLAMMVPSLLPFLMSKRPVAKSVWGFLFGYLAVWALCCVVGLSLQYLLYAGGYLNNQMVITSHWFSAVIFFAIGIYQFTQVKAAACINRKRVIDQALNSSSGHGMAWKYGTQYGMSCVKGCCPLMLSMFAFGLMNIVAMAGLTILMYIETNSSVVERHTRYIGITAIALGVFSLFFNLGSI